MARIARHPAAPGEAVAGAAAEWIPPRPTLPKARAASKRCRACHLWRLGTQTVFGPLVGAAVFTLLPEILRGSANWRYVVFAAGIILLMALRPQGLITGGMLRRLFDWRDPFGKEEFAASSATM